MDDNGLACGLKLVHKATAVELRSRTTVRLSQPTPHDEFLWLLRRPGALKALTRTKRQQLLGLTAASGNLPNLKASVEAVGLLPYKLDLLDHPAFLDVSESAGKAGHLLVCVWLHQQGWPLNPMLLGAARGGHRAVCKMALAQGAYDSEAPWVAGAAGHLDLMDWLVEEMGAVPAGDEGKRGSGGRVCNYLTEEVSFSMLQRFCDHVMGAASLPLLLQHVAERFPVVLDQVVSSERAVGRALSAIAGSQAPDWQACFIHMEERAVAAGINLQVVKDQFQASGPLFKCADAVARLQWLLQRGWPYNDPCGHSFSNTAALRFLLSVWNNAPLPSADVGCAEAGNLEALQQVLRPAGWVVKPQQCCRSAARNGHLPVVQWLVTTFGHVIRLDAVLLYEAFRSGNLELVAWLRERGCAWSSVCYTAGVLGGCEEVLERLVEWGCPLPAAGSPYHVAVEKGDVAMLACLRRLGCPVAPRTLDYCLKVAGSDLRRQGLARTWCVAQGGQAD